MDFENMNIWCWLIPALVGLISAILGYLLGKASGTRDEDELTRLRDANAQLQADLDVCGKNLEAAKLAALIPFDADMAKSVFGKKVKENDLKIVEGIGPKIEKLFQAEGIDTWKILAETDVDRCKAILKGGGEKFKVHDPTSWPLQAKMCYHNQWHELLKWQDGHKGGRM
jgi:predicted flap endonuclease-1-like 5' DNA nuclease